MKTLSIILSIFLVSFVQGQDVQEILSKSIQAIANLNKVSYHTEIHQTNPLNGDTMNITSDCLLKRMPQDTITGMYYYFKQEDSGFHKYDGKAYYSYSPEYYNFILRYSLRDNPEKFKSITLPMGISPPEVTSTSYYSNSLLNLKESLSSMLEQLQSNKNQNRNEIVLPDDTLVDNIKCYGITIKTIGTSSSWIRIICIDKKSLLPTSYMSETKGGSVVINNQKFSMNQYTMVKYSNIKDSIPNFDNLLSDESLPKGIEVVDHIPMVETLKKGDMLPSWRHPEVVTDKMISSDSLIGKIVVLDFTSTWCIHCAEGSVDIKNLSQKFRNEKDVVFINVFSSSIDNRDKVLRYIKQHHIEGINVYNAKDCEKQFGIQGYPNFYIVDRHGGIAFCQRGYSPNLIEILSKELQSCLENE